VIFNCQSIEETQSLAKKLARKTSPGTVISLIGDLGAGKTTFTKGFARQMGIKDHVTSPTFKLISEYQGNEYILNHIDAYRMNGIEDFLNIGGEEYLISKNSITIIEWGDLLNDILPLKTIRVNFERIKSPKESRKIEISGIKFV
tara:strand:+ start:302 stop:736 length:435 start_codon:yes stop_codon:yes gene_type:complete